MCWHRCPITACARRTTDGAARARAFVNAARTTGKAAAVQRLHRPRPWPHNGGMDTPGPRRLTGAQEYLKPIVYGGNDGIVTTFAIVAGFAGANAEGAAGLGVLAILVFGLANLFADAVSMGLGEFLSGRSHRELYEAEHRREQRRITASGGDPDGIATILQGRGLTAPDAREAAAILARSPPLAADLLMAYDTNIADPSGTSPAVNGLITFTSFVTFGVLPLLPYFFLPATALSFRLSVAATFAALVLLGLLRWSATGVRLARAVGETVLVGGICALVAYVVGAVVAAF